jgi:predicted RNA-binding protein with PUA-like domain
VGLAKIVNEPFEDPGEPGKTADGDIKAPLFHVEPVKEASTPVTLADLKADDRFDEFALVRQPRLSVMPVPPKLDKAIRKMAGL